MGGTDWGLVSWLRADKRVKRGWFSEKKSRDFLPFLKGKERDRTTMGERGGGRMQREKAGPQGKNRSRRVPKKRPSLR